MKKMSNYTGIDPKHNVPTVQPNLTVHLNGLGVAQAAPLTPHPLPPTHPHTQKKT